MKITNLEICGIRADVLVVTGGTYQISARRAILCRISTDEGIVRSLHRQ